MNTEITVLNRDQWAEKPDAWKGEFQGTQFGTNVSVIFYTTDTIGGGPKLHVHPYDEVFIVRQGRALFTIGEHQREVSAGQIIFGPANIPHKFINLGPVSVH